MICGYVKRSSSKIDLIFRDDILFGALVNMSAISKKSLCTFWDNGDTFDSLCKSKWLSPMFFMLVVVQYYMHPFEVWKRWPEEAKWDLIKIFAQSNLSFIPKSLAETSKTPNFYTRSKIKNTSNNWWLDASNKFLRRILD